jgi:hypothetical protein
MGVDEDDFYEAIAVLKFKAIREKKLLEKIEQSCPYTSLIHHKRN